MFIQFCEFLFVMYIMATSVFEAIQMSLLSDDDHIAMLYGLLGFVFGWIIFPICLIKHLRDKNGGEL